MDGAGSFGIALNMTGMSDGEAWVNGHSIGRYTLATPSPTEPDCQVCNRTVKILSNNVVVWIVVERARPCMMPDQSTVFTCIMHYRLLDYYGTTFSWYHTGPGATVRVVASCLTTSRSTSSLSTYSNRYTPSGVQCTPSLICGADLTMPLS